MWERDPELGVGAGDTPGIGLFRIVVHGGGKLPSTAGGVLSVLKLVFIAFVTLEKLDDLLAQLGEVDAETHQHLRLNTLTLSAEAKLGDGEVPEGLWRICSVPM